MRRKDREVSELKDIIQIVHRCDIVRLGLADNGVPYIVPLHFGCEVIGDKMTLYFHSAREGRKVDILKVNPHVCFELDCSMRIVKEENPCEWSAEYESVIGWGHVSMIESADERVKAMNLILGKYGFQGIPEYNQNAFQKTVLYRVTVDSVTGKRNMK